MNSIKSSGAGLLAGAVIFFLTIVLMPIVLGSESTPATSAGTAERAAHLLAEKATYLLFWTAEALTMGLITASAFVLAFRGDRAIGSSFGWSLFGVGSLANIGMYTFVMGSYYVAATVAEDMPVLYEIAEAAAFAAFNIANAIAFFGVTLVMLSLAPSHSRLLPAWLAGLGVVASISASLAATVGLATGSDTMLWMGPGALLGYLILGFVGLRIMTGHDAVGGTT